MKRLLPAFALLAAAVIACADATSPLAMCSLPEIAFADPDADDWAELSFSRVVLSNENLRARIRVRPAVPDAVTFKTILGGGIMLAADETSPDGVFFPLDDIPGSHGLSNLWPSFLLGAGYVSYLCEQRRPERTRFRT